MTPHASRQGELLAWLASAREWLGEFAEEGIERIENARAVAREPESESVRAVPAPAGATASEALHLFAAAILARGDAAIRDRLAKFRETQSAAVPERPPRD